MSGHTPAEVIQRIAEVADTIGWRAGVGGSETAGAIVSYLAKHPDLIEPFFAGDISPLDFGANWLHEGCLSWQGSDGNVWTPEKAAAARAARATASLTQGDGHGG